MKYLTYEFYKEEYGGKVPEPQFKPLAIKVAATIDYYTTNKIENTCPELSRAMCELVDLESNYQQHEGKELISETVSTHTKQFAPASKSHEAAKQEIIKRHLGHTGLMYRGVY